MPAISSIIFNSSFKHKRTVNSGVLFLETKLSTVHSIVIDNEVKLCSKSFEIALIAQLPYNYNCH